MRKKIKLGIFFILTIVLLVFSVSILGNLKLKGNGYRIYVDYVFIGDLLVNGKVSYRGGGINIGFIEDIAINPDGTIRVTLFITDKNVILPEGTRFTIQTVGLGLGEKYIMATPPTITTEGLKSLPPESVVKGVEPFSLESTLGSIGDIGKELNLDEFTSIITNMSSTIELITKIINTNEADINEIISNVNKSIANINVISRDLSSIIADIESGKGTVGGLMKDTNLQTNVSQIIENLKIFSEKVRDNPSVLLFRETQTNK
ncbi:MlaD family protein [Brachyspira catarrhinii]|uniref:MCE family protein n=1 Tax=Brachyspira catarrhinii TaxID=2528966 RepID=A0ABY2TU37_9SPIR|nr:MlaD family protein [Brachyspira catarrhinii]TKZ36332.1 MCE family protein [Brachyspira catarrhinii]